MPIVILLFDKQAAVDKALATLKGSRKGKIKIDDEIKQNNKIFGKVLIDQSYPFGLIKFKDNDIKISENFICGSAKIKLLKPKWFE